MEWAIARIVVNDVLYVSAINKAFISALKTGTNPHS